MTRPPRPGWAARVADVTRSADQARVTYDRLARWYDLIEAPFERRARVAGLRLLDARQGEHILEIGFGTGHTLAALQRQVGTTGLLVGIDLALRMAQRTRRRLGTPATHLTVAVLQGDARHLPLHNASFDAVTLAFTLDLISTDDIPIVLSECRRVLRTHGRLVIVSLDLPAASNRMTRLYLAAHRRWPRLADCRPLPIRDVLTSGGYTPVRGWTSTIAGIPVCAITATR